MPLQNRQAYVQVWGKGFRVTADSEEFQRLVPTDAKDLELELERHISGFRGWGPLLESLYDVLPRELAKEHCVLFRNDHLCAVTVDRSEDRFKRSSPVVISACVEVSWEVDDIADVTARLVGLGHRLAREYADVFRGAPSKVQGQLRDGLFLPDRRFDLAQEPVADASNWREVTTAVQEWQDVEGVSTLRVLPLGANVLIGTRHEAERLVGGQLDGRYDVAEKRIEPLTAKLKPWPKPAPKPSPKKVVVDFDHQSARSKELESIGETLRSLDASVRTVSQALVQFMEDVRAFWFGPKPPRR